MTLGRGLLRLLLLSLAFALATAALGWLTVPVLGALWGFISRDEELPARLAGWAAALGWAFLLGLSAVSGGIFELERKLSQLMDIPTGVIFLVFLIFPALLAGSAAGAVHGVKTWGHETEAERR